MNGRELHFHLSGINNQNFIMRDEETGSWWQQVSGEAIFGPLKGTHLEPVMADEVSFQRWKSEHPTGRVLRPDPKVVAAGRYEKADWETSMLKVPTVTKLTDKRLEPRTLVIGVSEHGQARAWPVETLKQQSPLLDTIGGVPIVLMMDIDKRSIRVFERQAAGRKLELFAKMGTSPLTLVDAETASEWDFTGRAIRGPLAGQQLPPVRHISDYWFDWKTYNPSTTLYTAGTN